MDFGDEAEKSRKDRAAALAPPLAYNLLIHSSRVPTGMSLTPASNLLDFISNFCPGRSRLNSLLQLYLKKT
jgi:hypothetical protein